MPNPLPSAPSPAGPRRRSASLCRVACALAVLAVPVVLAGCESAPPTKVNLYGRGWGHGRGMGQWGAYGYAVDHGWSGTMILNRFYGGTRTAKVSTEGRQRVFLSAQEGRDLIVYNSAGALKVSTDSYAGPRRAFRVQRVDETRFRVFTGDSCSGPWREWGSLKTGSIRIKPPKVSDDPRTMLQVCQAGSTRYYRGDLLAVHGRGTIETVNDVRNEDLVRSVIAREMSPSWADAGRGRGAAALRAQAVAARSYALSGDSRFAPWASTCDSTQCQAYGGFGTRMAGSSTISKVEDPRTDTATLLTLGQVRTYSNGAIARTEFSSSSGGWSAGGSFPAVSDAGDDTAANPNHTWAATLSRGTIEAAYDRRQGRDLGTFSLFDSVRRNGHGADGGRVLSIRARFSKGDVTISGESFRSLFGLKSDWFIARLG